MEADGTGSHPDVSARCSRADDGRHHDESRDDERGDDERRDDESTSVVETAEVRWFAMGRVPLEVTAWFTHGGTIGMVEQRCDTYRISVRHDVGLKRRHREIPELKVRQSVADPLALGDGPPGHHEIWRRWSPARDVPGSDERDRWVDVHKSLLKRRFAGGGEEYVLTGAVRPMTVAGCEVEVVSVTVEDIEAWTFAFAASGPEADRTSSIVAAWDSLDDPTPSPVGFWSAFSRSSGYPGWLRELFPANPAARPPRTAGTRNGLPA